MARLRLSLPYSDVPTCLLRITFRRTLGRAILWPNVQMDDLLCANNQTYHREIPAHLGENGEELPADESVRPVEECCPLHTHPNNTNAHALATDRGGVRQMGRGTMCGTPGGAYRQVRTKISLQSFKFTRLRLSSTCLRFCVRACSAAWSARGFVHMNPWTIKLSIPDPRNRKSNDDLHSTGHKGEL